MADPDALAAFYGDGFQPNRLSQTGGNVEQVDRDALAKALEQATRNTSKGPYSKIRHAWQILKRLNSSRVRAVAAHCDRLFRTVETKLQ